MRAHSNTNHSRHCTAQKRRTYDMRGSNTRSSYSSSSAAAGGGTGASGYRYRTTAGRTSGDYAGYGGHGGYGGGGSSSSGCAGSFSFPFRSFFSATPFYNVFGTAQIRQTQQAQASASAAKCVDLCD